MYNTNTCRFCYWLILEENGICEYCQEEIERYEIPQDLLELFVIEIIHVCCICYDQISSKSLLDCPICSTKYHEECLNQWKLQSKRCAVCRRGI